MKKIMVQMSDKTFNAIRDYIDLKDKMGSMIGDVDMFVYLTITALLDGKKEICLDGTRENMKAKRCK
jgi:hypothetical protein